MTRNYKGSLSLEWFNKTRAIILQEAGTLIGAGDTPAPKINWVNKDESLFYEILSDIGAGKEPFWVDRNDIRVKETRPLIFQKAFVSKQKEINEIKTGTSKDYVVNESGFDDPDIQNILIKGDNLLALNTLKNIFENKPEGDKVKCIFIDPPYNTEYAFKHYDDNLAHSEWLTLMRDRLVVLKSLLSNDGSIWISIDDDESHYLKLLCDEIFGRKNFIANVVWEKKYSPQNDAKWLSDNHDHILVYAKNKETWRPALLPRTPEMDKLYKNPDNDLRGPWMSDNLSVKTYAANADYPIKTPSGRIVNPPESRCWSVSKDKLNELIQDNRIWFGKDGNNTPRLKRFLTEVQDGVVCKTLWSRTEVGDNQDAKREVKNFNEEDVFDTPKPERLIKRILQLATKENDIILDCFGGSGTTFAVAHKMKRKWIGIEIGNHIDSHIIPRLKEVISGNDQNAISMDDDVKWQGGGTFKYYHLGNSIINSEINDFNWNLGKKFIEESLLASYDYVLDKDINLSLPKLISNTQNEPSLGYQIVGNKTNVCFVSLNEPDKTNEIMGLEEIQFLYAKAKEKYNPHFITIFTNRGINIAYDVKPDDLEIVKIPQAIFAELEK